jgi:peptidoglycan/LPS O-acetylase OafA/YrhL
LVRMRSWGLAAVAMASAVLRYWIETRVMHGVWYGYFCCASQLYFFVIGMLLFRYYRRPGFKALPGRLLFGWGAGLLGLSMSYETLPMWFIHGVLYPGFLLIVPSLFAWSKDLAWDRLLGNLSYPIYMVQMVVVGVLATVFKTQAGIIAVPLAVGIAWFLWRWIDEPVDRFRQEQLRRVKASQSEG